MSVRILTVILAGFFLFSAFMIKPSFNRAEPGCAGSGCHVRKAGNISVNILNNLRVEVKLNAGQGGRPVGGELVSAGGEVVDFVDKTAGNSMILSAPRAGIYTVNAGFKNNGLSWDSVRVAVSNPMLNFPVSTKTRSTFELYPNHPEPFNRQTIIRFSLPKTEAVELAVYDRHGEIVRRLARKKFAAGVHAVAWNGKDDFGRPCAPGIYLCQITGDSDQLVRRMTLSH